MPHPNLSLLQGFSQKELDSYLGQLYLRRHLNSIHRMFYSPSDPKAPPEDKFKSVELVQTAVEDMNWVPPSLSWRQGGDPATDILGARLRAKFWGAQMITFRPFIRQILQFSFTVKDHPTSPNYEAHTEFREGFIAPYIPPNTKSVQDIDPEVLKLAKKGVQALIESTRAFHGLGELRPIITNVFGTAHA